MKFFKIIFTILIFLSKSYVLNGQGVSFNNNISINIIQDTVRKGDTLIVELFLGNQNFQVDSLMSTSFRLHFDTNFIKTDSYNFNWDTIALESLWGNVNSEFIPAIFNSGLENGYLEFSITKLNGYSNPGSCKIGNLSLKIIEDELTGVQENIKIYIDKNYSLYKDISTSIDISKIDSVIYFTSLPTPILNIVNIDYIDIYPNPTSGDSYFSTSLNIQKIQLFDSNGKACFINSESFNHKDYHLNLNYLPNGLYYLIITTQEKVMISKFFKI